MPQSFRSPVQDPGSKVCLLRDICTPRVGLCQYRLSLVLRVGFVL